MKSDDSLEGVPENLSWLKKEYMMENDALFAFGAEFRITCPLLSQNRYSTIRFTQENLISINKNN